MSAAPPPAAAAASSVASPVAPVTADQKQSLSASTRKVALVTGGTVYVRERARERERPERRKRERDRERPERRETERERDHRGVINNNDIDL